MLLEQCPGEPLCDACLAFACSVSLTEMRTATSALARIDAFVRGPDTCGSCRRQTTAIVAHGEPVAAKCTHCSGLMETSEQPFMVGDDMFHQRCWRLLVSDDKIRLSRALSRASRQMIQESRARMGRAAASSIDD